MNKATKIGIGALIAAAITGSLVILNLWCRHKYSGPFFRKKDGKREAIMVCYKCSAEFNYDLETRKPGKERKR